jgi:hypothetical protein
MRYGHPIHLIPDHQAPKGKDLKKPRPGPALFLKEIAVRLVEAGDFTMLPS